MLAKFSSNIKLKKEKRSALRAKESF